MNEHSLPIPASRQQRRKPRVVLVTQEESIFLPRALDYLLRRRPEGFDICHCIILRGSSIRAEGRLQALWRLFRIFGLYFVVRNMVAHLKSLLSKQTVEHVMTRHRVHVIRLKESINHATTISKLRSLEPDYVVNIAGSEIFQRDIIGVARIAILNLHTSKLPNYRGLLPTFWAMLKNEKETAVSVFIVDEGIDTGPIIIQKSIAIGGLSLFQLIRITKLMGMDAILEAIDVLENKGVTETNDPHPNGSYFSFPTRADVLAFRRQGKRIF